MIQWLRRKSVLGRSRSSNNSRSRGGLGVDDNIEDMDPETLFEAMMSHWHQAAEVMQEGLAEPSTDIRVFPDSIVVLFNHMDQMVNLLLAELNAPINPQDPSVGPLLDFFFTEAILEKLLMWSLRCCEFLDSCKLNLLKLYENLISGVASVPKNPGLSPVTSQSILVHKPILLPLLKLLEHCSRMPQAEVERHFVVLLNQICINLSRDNTLLEFFFEQSSNNNYATEMNGHVDKGPEGGETTPVKQQPMRFSVFTFLIPYLYHDGNVGQLARDAILLVLTVSRKVEPVAHFIAEHSNFCPVLATGLSGLYSTLPKKFGATSDDWHGITLFDVEQNPSLHFFRSALEFCNAVIQVAHPFVQEQLLDYIYQGFLVPVIGSALNQPSLEEVISSTAYYDFILHTITEPELLKIFIKFILIESHDNVSILESLITRLNSNSRLCLVSLSLFHTLLDLNCEDFMYELVFKYLIPCTHIMVSQNRAIRQQDIYGKASNKFLSLIPSSCLIQESCGAKSGSQEELSCSSSPPSGATSASGSLNASRDSLLDPYPIEAVNGLQTITEELQDGPVSRSEVLDDGGTPRRPSIPKDIQFCQSYFSYVIDRKKDVQTCFRACATWALPYDGVTPDPCAFQVSTPDPVGPGDDLWTGTQDSGISVSSERTSEVLSRNGPSPFVRHASIRKSITNDYFANKRLSALNSSRFGAPHGISAVELTLGPDDFMVALEGLEPLEVNSHGSTVQTPTDTGSSNECETPGRRRRANFGSLSAGTPGDYLKLTFDDLDSQNISDDSGDHALSAVSIATNANLWVLRGWSEVKDLQTFIELLGRVRPAAKFLDCCDQAHFEFIDDALEKYSERGLVREEDLAKMAEAVKKESQDGAGSGGKEGVAGDEAIVSPRPPLFKSSFTNPDIGPFLNILLSKVEHMLSNSLYVNLQLSGLLCRLACFPQPLLSSFLLNSSLVFQPSIRSLTQILSGLRHKVDSWAYTVDGWEVLLQKGRRFLASRQKRFEAELRARSKWQGTTSVLAPNPSRSDHWGSHRRGGSVKASSTSGYEPGLGVRSKPRSFSIFESGLHSAGSHYKRMRAGSLEALVGHGLQRFHQHGSSEFGSDQSDGSGQQQQGASSQSAALDMIRTKNVVYCAIVLEELLKELSVIAQEHHVARMELDPNLFVQSGNY